MITIDPTDNLVYSRPAQIFRTPEAARAMAHEIASGYADETDGTVEVVRYADRAYKIHLFDADGALALVW